jgi:predicted membrane-bound spermidine synthase/Flp pilus assembly protein TadD
MTGLLYLLFFFSGLSGLIYQVVWVRLFGNAFGNTLYSTALVVAVFMLGLGVGSWIAGAWADRRYATQPESLLRAYGYFELAIGVLGLGIAALLPHLSEVSALVSSYSRDANGWYVLSTTSYLARGAIAIVLLTPVTLLMGGTLTLLIRHLVRKDLDIGGWRIAVLYGINTVGAALGCLLTDFALVPASGLRGAQMVAVFFNIFAAVGALYLASREKPSASGGSNVRRPGPLDPAIISSPSASAAVRFTSAALALSGFAAMGMEILWFRHFTILLGGFRAVFSLLLTVILIGIGAGSLAGGFLSRWPAQWLMVVQGLFVAATLLGLAAADARNIDAVVTADSAYQAAVGGVVEATLGGQSGLTRSFTELWFNLRPMLLEVGLPALLMGFAFPLANGIIQRAERSVGRRAGVLYLSNTVGAVCGSLAAGFLLLPRLGIQGSATIVTVAAALAVVPVYLATGGSDVGRTFLGPPSSDAGSNKTRPTYRKAAYRNAVTFAASILVAGGAIGLWLQLPSDYVISRALAGSEDGRLLARSEGLTEAIAVTDVPGKGRTLFTNGHPMSSTRRLSQRYMRALAHIPLLSIDNPETVLVIGFGVGNTTHAATLHPSIRQVEVADLSKDILAHSSYFKDVNGDVLNDPRVVVYVNDGRHHLQMQPSASYDLIALEPPPIGYAGVSALYSKEFYTLARTRLKPKGYLSQWLPAYQVPGATTLAMIRAFVDVFPQAVLLSGAQADLVLLGVNDSRIEIGPARVATVLSRAPAVQADLQRVDLGSPREIVGTFVGSAQKLGEATRDTAPVSDDHPIQEYGVLSLLNFGEAVPASVVDLSQVAAWCLSCFADGTPVPLVEGLDAYLALLDRAYTASPREGARLRSQADRGTRTIAGSAYLGAVVPETADLHNLLGIALASRSKFAEAISEFREALRLEPDSASTHWNLGAALASNGAREDAIEHLRRSVQLDASNGQAHYDLAVTLVAARQLEGAVDEFRAAVQLMPDSVEAHNNLGIALASLGKLDEAIEEFERTLTLQPESADARRNLSIALRKRGR